MTGQVQLPPVCNWSGQGLQLSVFHLLFQISFCCCFFWFLTCNPCRLVWRQSLCSWGWLWTPGLLASTSQVLGYWCIITPSNSYSLLHNNLKITFVCARSLSSFVYFNLTITKMPEEIFLYVPNNFILININSLAYETNQEIVIKSWYLYFLTVQCFYWFYVL